ncbi:hypothetical protein MSG28_013613 [Choristoneura fumiferana]|uniref:Uncharacterized protein n=1 Tax=Choristoneura fumiferana TaxID=7141 RepID=A0ACC0K866_CHOFU|nr:hypothetical protein MSG28_013613 [Choristoneura fumiferana]
MVITILIDLRDLEGCDEHKSDLKRSESSESIGATSFPESEEEMKMIAEQFKNQVQVPNLLGAVDGKHVKIIPPPGAGSHFIITTLERKL